MASFTASSRPARIGWAPMKWSRLARNTWATITRPIGTPSNRRPAGEVARPPPFSRLSPPCGKLCGKLRRGVRTLRLQQHHAHGATLGRNKVAPRASPRGRFDNLVAVALAPFGRAPLAAPLCWAPSAVAPGALAPGRLFNWGEGAALRSGVPPPAGGGCGLTPRALAPHTAHASRCVAGAMCPATPTPPTTEPGYKAYGGKYHRRGRRPGGPISMPRPDEWHTVPTPIRRGGALLRPNQVLPTTPPG